MAFFNLSGIIITYNFRLRTFFKPSDEVDYREDIKPIPEQKRIILVTEG